MLIDGKKRVNIPFRRTIVFPRIDEDITFTAVAVPCSEEFERKCPSPEPPKIKNAKGELINIDYQDSKFLKETREHNILRFDHQVIKSLENVQWETVDLEDPTTWKNWRKECLDVGMTDTELLMLLNAVIETHQPSNELIETMKKDFLAQQARKEEAADQDQSSQNTEH